MNILNASHALGFGAQWLTEWPAFKDEVKQKDKKVGEEEERMGDECRERNRPEGGHGDGDGEEAGYPDGRAA